MTSPTKRPLPLVVALDSDTRLPLLACTPDDLEVGARFIEQDAEEYKDDPELPATFRELAAMLRARGFTRVGDLPLFHAGA